MIQSFRRMLFNSLHFFIFFPVVAFFYFFIPHRYRWILLLVASYYFYLSWNVGYGFLLLSATLFNYGAALWLEKIEHVRNKKLVLAAFITANIGFLGFFKYYNFFADSLHSLAQFFGNDLAMPYSRFLLPVGISFYTFQIMSYVIDVYRKQKSAERHFGIFALYVSFFPQLVAGPIERSTRLLPQFYEKKNFDYIRVTDGLKLMVWGLFKKVVIADRLAILVNMVYGNPDDYTGLAFVIATLFFAWQIYCDFSGYSDMAIGAAQVLGFNLMDNFKRPYFAKNIIEFWQRWHISLSSWFKDYLYIPLGGSRAGRLRSALNVLATFLLSGLWHGANWTFVVWGLLHGLYVLVSRTTLGARQWCADAIGLSRLPRLHHAVQIMLTFFLTSFAWIFFRAESIGSAFVILRKMAVGSLDTSIALIGGQTARAAELVLGPGLGLSGYGFFVAVLSIVALEGFHYIQRHGSIRHMLDGRPAWFRWTLYYVAIISIALFGVFDEVPFIYFQF